ncbi:MAG: AMP-binding protein [Sporichthyaceae bacterium]
MSADRRVGNLADLLRAAAAARPTRVALSEAGTTLSWAQVDAAVDALAARLRAADLRLADRVGLLVASPSRFAVAYLGVLRAGLVAVPCDVDATATEIGAALGETGARALLFDAPLVAPARAGVAAAGVRVDLLEVGPTLGVGATGDGATGGAAQAPEAGVGDPSVQRSTAGEAPAVLLETAGTGGRPKRAMLSHRALLANVAQCAALEPPPVAPEDVVLLALPLSGVFGLSAVLGQALHAGATLVVATDPDPAAVLELIARTGVTSVAGSPAMFASWAARPEAREALAGVRVLVSGSTPLRPEAAAAFHAATGKTLGQGYGLTEAAGVVAADIAGSRAGSVGAPLPGIAVRVRDASGLESAEGDPGELSIRGPNLFSGYWPDGQGGPDADGWFATGDVGWADADGALFMVSTRSDVVVVSGFAVYPAEVEDVLNAHPGVREAAVVGVPDPTSGAAVKALVVLEPDARVDVAELLAWCGTRLGRFKVPKHVEFAAALPHSAAGGLARGRLR